jgi:hypothetical protein
MRKSVLVVTLLLSGCVMGGMNREGIAIIRDQAQKSQVSVVIALKATNDLVTELTEAAAEERAPNLAPPLTAIATALGDASEAINETGKTAVTLQEGMGAAKNTPPQGKLALEAWRRRYAVMSKMLDAAMSWISKMAPSIPIPTKESPMPWSTTETTGLIGTILAALGAGGLGGKKLLNKRKIAKEEKAEAEESAAEAQCLVAKLRDKVDASEFDDMMSQNKRLKARLAKADYEKTAGEDGHLR